MTALLTRSARNLALGLIAFALTSAAIRSWVPLPETLNLRAKLEAFGQVKDEIDAVYVGSSRFRRAFRPDVIDPIVGQRVGRPFRSFNLGIAALTSYEQNTVIARVVALEPARLRTVIVEAPTFFPSTARTFNMFSERALHWHAVANTARLIASVFDAPDITLLQKLDLAAVHTRLMALRFVAHGLGPRIFAEHFRPPSPSLTNLRDELVGHAGFETERGDADSRWMKQRRAFLAVADEYALQIDRWKTRSREGGDIDPADAVDVRAMRDQRRRIREAGLSYVPLVPPLSLQLGQVRRLARTDVMEQAIDMARPEDFPELYALESRHDREHLSDIGSVTFSQLVAPSIADRIVADESVH